MKDIFVVDNVLKGLAYESLYFGNRKVNFLLDEGEKLLYNALVSKDNLLGT